MTAKTRLLSHEDLVRQLEYCPVTGLFKRRTAPRNKPGMVGCPAGTLKKDGYLYISLNSVLHKAHRLAWMYVHGKNPERLVDHINGDRTDNRIANLREATNVQNLHNRGQQKNNTSGYKGVTWDKTNEKWMAQIRVQGKNHKLGRFVDIEDARKAYVDAASLLVPGFGRA